MDGVIFDIDGTIWDSRESVAHAWDAVIREEGHIEKNLTVEDLTPLFGRTTTEIEEALFHGDPFTQEEKDRLMQICFDKENEHLYEEPGLVYAGVEELLQNLAQKYPLFIVSNCNTGYIEAMLEVTGLGKYFKDHLCFADTMKPKGENIRLIADRHGLKEPVYVGDTQGDLDACRMAGVPMVYVTYGLGKADGADFIAHNPAEVYKILGK
jgi:phosphoglycolate phosphatase